MYDGKAYKTAQDACNAAIDVKPNYLEAMLLKADIRFALKEYPYVIKEIDAAMKLCQPTSPCMKLIKRGQKRDLKPKIIKMP